MINYPKHVDSTITVGQAEELFTDEHVHMLLLVENQQLVGTLLRTDLDYEPLLRELPARSFSVLSGRWVSADHDAAELLTRMTSQRIRRLAVVDETLTLKGLLCLKRNGNGFCSDADVQARALPTQRASLDCPAPSASRKISSPSCGDASSR